MEGIDFAQGPSWVGHLCLLRARKYTAEPQTGRCCICFRCIDATSYASMQRATQVQQLNRVSILLLFQVS